MNVRRRQPSGRALTLVEVAALVAVITLLCATMVAATGAVRGDSKNGRCLLNLSQTGYAGSIYAAQDPADMAIPVHPLQFAQDPDRPTHIGAYEWGGKSGVGWNTWLGPADPLNSKYGTKAGFGPSSRPLNGIIYRESFPDHLNPSFDPVGATSDTQLDLDVQACPADTGYAGVHFPTFAQSKLSSFDHFGTSYTANVFATSSQGGGPTFSNSPYLRNVADVQAPATTVAYYENNGRYAWSAAPGAPECSFVGELPPGPVHGWHGKDWMFNAVFIDGHADTIYMRGFANPRLAIYASWSGGQGSYDVLRCIIIRGEGWQIDTFPSQPIPTGLNSYGSGRPSWEHGIE